MRTPSGELLGVATPGFRAVADQQVYNLTVATDHTYYVTAGDSDLLVHNCAAKKQSKKSGKERGSDVPSWAREHLGNASGNTPAQKADSVMRQRFGDGKYDTGPALNTIRSRSTSSETDGAIRVSDRVFLLWHVHHVAEDESGAVKHFEPDGEFSAHEEDGDDVKLLGVYSSRENAVACVERAKELDGFRDEPECFYIDEYALDEDKWTTGFITV